jgi:hypothetical protein
MIFAGTQYKDYELHYVFGMDHTIKHKRICAVCAGLLKESRQYLFKEPEPVCTDGLKYYLIGLGYDKGTLRLITEDWQTNKKHWADEVYDYNGNRLTVKNVRFINAQE